MSLSDIFDNDDPTSVDNKIDIERAIGRLTFREATVLYLWAMCEKSQTEIGEIIGLTQPRISQILANIYKKQ
jgi:RNA polymerase sigma factor (sigma-70 family)